MADAKGSKEMFQVSRGNLEEHLAWLAGVRRDTGGEGEEKTARFITESLESYGLDVTVHEFDAFLSYPRNASLKVLDSDDFEPDCVTHSFAQSTGPEGLTGEIHVLATADFAGMAGRIVLLDGLCTPVTVRQASQAGVAGLIFVNEGDVVHNMIATTIWGTPGIEQLDRLPQVVAVSIKREDGERLKELAAAGSVSVRLDTEVETGWYRSKLPEVIIRGNGADRDQFVLVGGHYCSWEIGITDNSTGVACLLEMARNLYEQRDRLNRSVRLCWWPGHSHGRYSGSTWYADTRFHELADRCVAYHNIDSPGVRGATMYVARHTTAEIEEFCKNLIRDMTGQQEIEVHRPSRAADQSFVANGVSAYSTYPFLPHGHDDRRSWTGGCGNAWWWHSSADTPDKADSEILELDTRISLEGVVRLSNARVLPLDPTAAAAEAVQSISQFCMDAEGHFDLQELRGAADELLKAAERLREQARQVAVTTGGDGAPPEQQDVNAGLLRFNRLLQPVAYSKGGRYDHDPAEWSPVMSDVRSHLFPGLSGAEALDSLRGTEKYGFLKASLLRQANRATDLFRQAARLAGA